MEHRKIIIVGNGPIGLITALSLKQKGIAATIIAKKSNIVLERAIALSYANFYFLQQLNISLPGSTAIDQVHISHTGFGVAKIKHDEVKLPHLGFTIKYAALIKLLLDEAHKKNIEIIDIEVDEVLTDKVMAKVISYQQNISYSCNLLIMAEGGKIELKDIIYKKYDYLRHALVAELELSKPHNNCSYERLEKKGPLVLLPYFDNYKLVWSVYQKELVNLKNPAQLQKELEKLHFMQRFNSFKVKDEEIKSFALKLKTASRKVVDNIVLIGNAAQTLHPISAQGLNLGIRDAKTLTQTIANNSLTDALSSYSRLRYYDSTFTTNFTHKLGRFVEHNNSSLLRSIGITTLALTPALRNNLANNLILGL